MGTIPNAASPEKHRVAYLSMMTPDDVLRIYAQYMKDRPYGVARWRRWRQTCAMYGIDSLEATACWKWALGGWRAGRPKPLRDLHADAVHDPPYLEDVHRQAMQYVRALGNTTLRTIDRLSPEQKQALSQLWVVLRDITYGGQVSCVGITKAAIFLTEGRIGPAMDSNVRDTLGLPQTTGGKQWLEQLRAIREDLVAFETKHHVALEDLVPAELRPLAVGRAYDLAAFWQS